MIAHYITLNTSNSSPELGQPNPSHVIVRLESIDNLIGALDTTNQDLAHLAAEIDEQIDPQRGD